MSSPVNRRSFSAWKTLNLAAPKVLQGAEALLYAPVPSRGRCLQPRRRASMHRSLWWQKRLNKVSDRTRLVWGRGNG